MFQFLYIYIFLVYVLILKKFKNNRALGFVLYIYRFHLCASVIKIIAWVRVTQIIEDLFCILN
jgi:hypothetical protein